MEEKEGNRKYIALAIACVIEVIIFHVIVIGKFMYEYNHAEPRNFNVNKLIRCEPTSSM